MDEIRQSARSNEDEAGDVQSCLVVFCKRPKMFQGKQRLAETIGAEQCLVFARSFLDCALEDAAAWPGRVVLSPASCDDEAWATGLLERDFEVLAQPNGGLGERLQAIDRELRKSGHKNLVFIGTDAPALKPAHYEETRREITLFDVVLAPASDGGVVIMGSSVPWPELQALPWSTDQLGEALAAKCIDDGLGVKSISASYDIDVEADLLKLSRDLERDKRPARQRLHRQLHEFLYESETHYA